MKKILLMAAAATCALAAQCPTSPIAPVTKVIQQVFDGAQTPYTFTISPSSPVSTAPAGATACGGAGYVSQWDDKGACSSYASRQMANPAVNGDNCVYSFADSGAMRTMSVSLSCDASATTLQMGDTVQVSRTGTMNFGYVFTGKYAGVCVDTTVAPVTVEPTTAAPKPEYLTLVKGAVNATLTQINATVMWYNGVLGPVVEAVAADTVITVHAFFYTATAQDTFVTAVKDGDAPGVASAEPIAHEPKDSKNKTGLIVGLIIAAFVIIAIIVGVVVYRRRSKRDAEYDNVDMNDRPSVPNKEHPFV